MTEKNSTNAPSSTVTRNAGASTTSPIAATGRHSDPVAQVLEKLRRAVKEIVRGATAGRLEAS